MVTVEELVKKLRAGRHWCPGDAYTDPMGSAFLIGVDVRTLRRWRTRLIGPPWIEGGPRAVRYDLRDLASWLNSGEKISPDKGGQTRANADTGDGDRRACGLVST